MTDYVYEMAYLLTIAVMQHYENRMCYQAIQGRGCQGH